MSSSSGSKKRVRFSDAGPQVHEYEVEPKRRALDPMEQLEGEISGVCLEPAGDVDAGQAAAQRAACRRNQLLAAFDEGTAIRQGDDVEGEEEYEDPEEMFDSVTGIPFEPFHLKREREEGYFDEDGTYVEYKKDEVEDAWADSLANVEVDEEWLARVLGGRGRGEAGGAAAAAAAAGEAPDMSAEEIRERKRRVVDLLLPGESVLHALRRLAAVRQPAGAARPASPGSGGGAGGSPGAEAAAAHARALRGPAMPPAVREKFEQLTELSSVLMDQGEYSVHSMTREQLERSIQAGGPSAAAGSARGASPTLRQPAATSATGDAGEQLAERLLAAAAPAAGGGGGQNGSAKAAGNGAASGGSEGTAPAAQQALADADLDMFADDGPAGGEAASTDATKAAARGGSDPAARQAQQPQQSQQGARGGVQRGTSADEQMQEAEQVEGVMDGAEQQQQVQQAAQPAGDEGGGAQQAEQQQGSAGGQPPELDGFVLDQSTGLWYSSDLGMWYDSGRRLFGDSSSGQWYSYDAGTGQYTLVPTAS